MKSGRGYGWKVGVTTDRIADDGDEGSDEEDTELSGTARGERVRLFLKHSENTTTNMQYEVQTIPARRFRILR